MDRDEQTQSEAKEFSVMDPFPEPNTYPSGWNMDSILHPAPNPQPEPEPLPDWYEEFDEPRTCPPGWNFS